MASTWSSDLGHRCLRILSQAVDVDGSGIASATALYRSVYTLLKHWIALAASDPPLVTMLNLVARCISRRLLQLRTNAASHAPVPTLCSAPRVPPNDLDQLWCHSFENVIGLHTAKAAIRQGLLLPIRYPHLFADARSIRPARRILLFGPPGTGKTCLAMACATFVTAIGGPFHRIVPSTLLSCWLGESERALEQAFAAASAHAHGMLFFDEIDSFCRRRSAQGDEASHRLKNEFLRLLQCDASGVGAHMPLIVAATNLPWDLDAAVMRRFDRYVYVGLPDATQRECLLRHFLGNCASECDLAALAKLCHGYSSTDISQVCHSATLHCMEELLSARWFRRVHPNGSPATEHVCSALEEAPFHLVPADPQKEEDVFDLSHWGPSASQLVHPRPVQMADVRVAIAGHARSVTPSMEGAYASWMQQRGMDPPPTVFSTRVPKALCAVEE